MTLEAVLFYAFAGVTVAAALGVILVRNSVHAVLLLVLTFFSAACLWLLTRAEFLAITLVLVYVGAVMVLFLFVVMMLDVKYESLRVGYLKSVPLALAVAGVMAFELIAVLGARSQFARHAPSADMATAAGVSNTELLGMALFERFLLPFEIAAVILTVGIVAAVALTLRVRGGARHQSAAEQVAVRSEDRVRVVKVKRGSAAFAAGDPRADYPVGGARQVATGELEPDA